MNKAAAVARYGIDVEIGIWPRADARPRRRRMNGRRYHLEMPNLFGRSTVVADAGFARALVLMASFSWRYRVLGASLRVMLL
jgi:hypothetical protein